MPFAFGCPACGQRHVAEPPQIGQVSRCGCGQAVIVPDPGPTPVDPITVFVPYHNPRALAAYYLGVFSLIPCLGCPLGLAALGLGLAGLRHSNAVPTAGGRLHAWVGILVGGLCGVVNTILLVLAVVSLALNR
ncbi:MAG: hypothetical protein IT204_11750 [Fimbriimonadaceae bacterium]|nr:hypothetical protein [Fimbriimonadaceae bacterium]